MRDPRRRMTFGVTLDLTSDLTSIILFILLMFPPNFSSSQQVVSERSWSGSVRFFNDWSSWGVWSVCSRTCGGGASVRTRTCLARNPVGGPCSGEPRQYKICNTKACPLGSEDFRELQCQAFNHRPLVSGSSFTWTSFNSGSDPCELTCLAVGHRFYYNFGRVLDGTSCGADSGSVCVNGRCLKAGCDQVLGSDLIEDVCMICGGHNKTCLHHQDHYRPAGAVFGYNEVAMIPAGATHVRVTDNSRSYLALQNVRSEFLINGDWTISRPGEYAVAGTKLLYKRSSDVWESFELNGPTQEDLHLMVLSTDPNPGIEYEYWLPPEQYFLYHGPKSPLRHAPRTATFTMATTRPAPVAAATIKAAPVRPQRVQKPPRQTSSLRLQPPVEPDQNMLPPPHKICGKCPRVRGRQERQKQYCSKDFVFRAQILQKRFLGSETRYDVQIVQTYRNRFRLEHREFVWASDQCDCPLLEPGRQYVLMVRRHINHERTLNRILLEPGSYSAPYRPREDALLLPLQRICDNRGQTTELREN